MLFYINFYFARNDHSFRTNKCIGHFSYQIEAYVSQSRSDHLHNCQKVRFSAAVNGCLAKNIGINYKLDKVFAELCRFDIEVCVDGLIIFT